MIIHRSFTGPTHLLSANVRGPVSLNIVLPCLVNVFHFCHRQVGCIHALTVKQWIPGVFFMLCASFFHWSSATLQELPWSRSNTLDYKPLGLALLSLRACVKSKCHPFIHCLSGSPQPSLVQWENCVVMWYSPPLTMYCLNFSWHLSERWFWGYSDK